MYFDCLLVAALHKGQRVGSLDIPEFEDVSGSDRESPGPNARTGAPIKSLLCFLKPSLYGLGMDGTYTRPFVCLATPLRKLYFSCEASHTQH